jgi:hypothetical protein
LGVSFEVNWEIISEEIGSYDVQSEFLVYKYEGERIGGVVGSCGS